MKRILKDLNLQKEVTKKTTPSSHHQAPLVNMRGVHVHYGKIHALQGVDFQLAPGEIHGLVGEHRAGKSSLVKLLCGAIQPSQGSISIKGENYERITPSLAKSLGIALNHQQLSIIPSLNAVENIFSGFSLCGPLGFIKKKTMEEQASALMTHLGINIDIRCPLAFLTEKEKHMVELAMSLVNSPDIVIFDEISTKLTPDEMEKVYENIHRLKEEGKSVIYITHNLDEIFRLADRVTILRSGRRCGTEEIADLDRIKLIKLTYTFVRSRQNLEDENLRLSILKKFNNAVMDLLPIGFLLLDEEGISLLSNKNARAAIRLDGEEKNPLSWMNQQGWEEASEIRQCVLSRNAGQWDQLKGKDGTLHTLTCLPFRDDDFRFIGTILIIRDITQETIVNDYLIRSEKMASVAELAAGVAHEINNPLGIILNYVHLLEDEMNGSDGQQMLKQVESEILRIAEITQGMLSFSRPEPARELVDLGELVCDCLILTNHLAKKKGAQVLWSPPKESVHVFGSANRLKQVLLNLCKNAFEAILAGGQVQIKLGTEESFCWISVADDGMGIPPEDQSKVFEPFYTTKAGRENSGLGLSVSQHIIESHGGIILCESPGQGTQMTLRLPLPAQNHHDVQSPQEEFRDNAVFS